MGNLQNYERCLLSISNSSVNHILKHLLKHILYFKRFYVNTKQSIVITYDTKNCVRSPFQLSVALLSTNQSLDLDFKSSNWFSYINVTLG